MYDFGLPSLRTFWRRAGAVAAATVLSSMLTSSAASASDQIYFPATDNVINLLVQKINAETVRIDISAWYLTEHAISIALGNRFAAGVQVRLIGDRGSIFEIDPHTKTEFYYLANLGVPIRLRFNPTWYPEIDHWKMAIFAGQNVVEFGSANWTTEELAPNSTTDYDDETALFTDDPVLVGAFKTKFDRMWNDTTTEPESLNGAPPYFKDWPDACANEPTGTCDFYTQFPNAKPMVINTARLEPDNPMPADLIWGQGPDFNNRLVTEINNENTNILFVIYRLTVDNITQALLNKQTAGVPIQIIGEPGEYLNRKWPEFWLTHANLDKLWAAGIPIRMRAHQGLTHMKTLVTSTYATNASSNYAAAWQRDHDYFVSAATKPTIYTAIKNRVLAMWNDLNATSGFVDFQPQPPDAATLASPASNATGVALNSALVWNIAAFAVSYDVYLGTTPSNMALVGNVPAQMNNNPPSTYSFLPSLQGSTTYYWKVVSRTNATPVNASMIGTSPTYAFTTAPGSGGAPTAPASPSPADGSTGVSTTPTLSWGSSGATSYDVKFGTTNPPPTVSSSQAAASYAPSTLANSATYFWQIVARNSTGTTTGPVWSFTTAAASAPLPSPWTTQDIGSVGLSGSASFSGGTFTVQGAGADVWGNADAFRFVSQPTSGDVQIVVRVASEQNTDVNAKAGVMLRETLTPGSSHVILDVKPGGGIEFMTRTATGGVTTYLSGGTQPIPTWLMLARTGNTITGSASSNGTTWTTIGSTTTSMSTSANIGFLVSSHNPSVLNTSTFDNVAVTTASGTAPGAPGSASPASGATGVSTTPTLTWSASGATSYDVKFGTVNPPPTVSSNQATASYTPSALSNNVTYYWQIVAKNSTGNTTGAVWSFTTIASAPPAPGTPASPSPANSATGVSINSTLTWTSTNATSYDVKFGTANPPSTVSSNQATASYTPSALANNVTYFWQIVAKNSTSTTTGPVWSFTTVAASTTLPSPWTTQDIGSVGLTGSATFANNTFTVRGAGADIWGNADAFRFVSQPSSGDSQIIVRVASEQNTDANAKAGVMLRETLTAGSAHVILDVKPGGGIEFMTRTATGGVTTYLAGGTQAFPAWLMLSRSGNTVTGSVSSNGTTWTTIGSTTTSMSTNANIGFVVTSHNTGALNTSTFDNVAVTTGTVTPPPVPGTPTSPSPVSGATGVSTSTTLTWTSTNATSYDVAFGTTNPPPTVSTSQPGASYTPLSLAAGTLYFWQIVAKNSSGTTSGPVWSFTTAAGNPPAANVVIYASDVAAGSLHGSWSAASDPTSPNSTKLVTTDNGVSNANNPLASPVDYVDVTFTAAANTPYTIWLRMKALNNSKYNDSLWAQFSDAQVNGSGVYPINTTSGLLVNLANDSTGSSLNAWGWQNTAYWLSQPTTVTFASAGSHTLRIQVREDGVQFDQIVLSPTTYLNSAPGPVSNDSTIAAKP